MTSTASSRTAQTDAALLDVLAERWSPRAFDADAVLEPGALASVFEAARWAPSAGNSQPWRFIVARRGSETFGAIYGSLAGANQLWAGNAAALVVNIAETADATGKPRPWAVYDLGQAVAHLTVQAHAEGLHIHQMGGFDRHIIQEAFGLPERLVPMSVMAIGMLGDPATLPDALRERETAPRVRLGLDELVLHND